MEGGLLESHLVQTIQQGFVERATQRGERLRLRITGGCAVHLLDVYKAYSAFTRCYCVVDFGPLGLLRNGGASSCRRAGSAGSTVDPVALGAAPLAFGWRRHSRKLFVVVWEVDRGVETGSCIS
jgi:hypothetical protein